MKCDRPLPFLFPTHPRSDQDALGEAIRESVRMLDKSEKPIVIGDVELIRFKLQKEFAGFLDKTGFPYVTMMLGKTLLSEHHPQFIASLRETEPQLCTEPCRVRRLHFAAWSADDRF